MVVLPHAITGTKDEDDEETEDSEVTPAALTGEAVGRNEARTVTEQDSDYTVGMPLVVAIMVLHMRIEGGQCLGQFPEVPRRLRDAGAMIELIDDRPPSCTHEEARRERGERHVAEFPRPSGKSSRCRRTTHPPWD